MAAWVQIPHPAPTKTSNLEGFPTCSKEKTLRSAATKGASGPSLKDLRIKKSETSIPPNKKLLLNYAEYLKDTGKSLPRLDKLVRTLKIFAVFLGLIPFKLATKENMVQILAKGGS